MKSRDLLLTGNLKCSKCGLKLPEVIFSILNNKLVCNKCDKQNFYDSYLSECKNEEEIELKTYEIALEQIKIAIKNIRDRIKSKDDYVDQICDYWIKKTNNAYELNEKGKNSLSKFLLSFDVDEIIDSIDIAFSKTNVKNEDKFKYLCGILNGKLKERNHSPDFSEVIKYWNYKRPQTWKKADEGKVEFVLTKYDVVKVKYYIDCVIENEKGWSDFDSVINALEEKKYE